MIHGEIKVTQLVSGRARIQTQIIWLQSPLNSYAICFLRQWSVLDLGSITLTPHHPLHTCTHTHTNTQLHSLQDKLSYVSFHILQRTLVQLSLYKKLKGRKGSEEGAGWGKGSRLGALGESHLTSGELWRSCAWNTPGPGWVLCLLNRDDVETLVPSYVRWRGCDPGPTRVASASLMSSHHSPRLRLRGGSTQQHASGLPQLFCKPPWDWQEVPGIHVTKGNNSACWISFNNISIICSV